MKSWLLAIAILGLASGCCEREPRPDPPQLPVPKELTILFEGLISYVQDPDGDGVTVLLVDSTSQRPGDSIPAHVPLVTFDSSNGSLANEVPWVLDQEDIEIALDPPPATKHLVVDPNVWAGTGSMSQLTGGASVIKPALLDMGAAPGEVVARVRLEHGKLEVDPRPEAFLNSAVTFVTAGGITHPTYSPSKIALLLRYTVTAPTAATKIILKAHPKGGMNLNAPKRKFEPRAQNLRVSVGNIAAQVHGAAGVDHDFARLYDLVTPTPANLFLPRFTPPPPGVGTRVCMGGGG